MNIDQEQERARGTLDQINRDTSPGNSAVILVNHHRQTIDALKRDVGQIIERLQGMASWLDSVMQSDTANPELVSQAVGANIPAPGPAVQAAPVPPVTERTTQVYWPSGPHDDQQQAEHGKPIELGGARNSQSSTSDESGRRDGNQPKSDGTTI